MRKTLDLPDTNSIVVMTFALSGLIEACHSTLEWLQKSRPDRTDEIARCNRSIKVAEELLKQLKEL